MRQLTHNQTIIELYQVCFAYSGQEVIKDISLQIHRGDYLGIVGPNGGGKTTLLKLMVNLLTPKNGTIKLFNTEIKKFNAWSKIGYVPQKSHLDTNYPITVEEMVAMGRYGKLGLFHQPSDKDRAKTLEALKNVDLLQYRQRHINDLSGGQQQRVLIARALASEPEIIFLDEPTVGIDIKTQKDFYSLLRKLNQQLDLTLILVTHELDIVGHEATELLYINRTKEYYGDPEEFLKGKYFHELIGKGGLRH